MLFGDIHTIGRLGADSVIINPLGSNIFKVAKAKLK